MKSLIFFIMAIMIHLLPVGLRVPDPGLTLISQTNPYTTGPFGISPQSMDRSLTQSSMGGMLEPSFHTLRWL